MEYPDYCPKIVFFNDYSIIRADIQIIVDKLILNMLNYT